MQDNCDAIVLRAAVYQTWSKDPDEIVKPAVLGTENVFKRLLYQDKIKPGFKGTLAGEFPPVSDWSP